MILWDSLLTESGAGRGPWRGFFGVVGCGCGGGGGAGFIFSSLFFPSGRSMWFWLWREEADFGNK